jgi:uncharacterized protein YraI
MKMILSASAVLVVFAVGMPAIASAFWPGTVIGAPASDPLNIRAWPSTSSTVIATATNGTPLSLTGRCKIITTNVSFRIDGGGSAAFKYNRMKKPNVWCQLVTSSGQVAWARGKNIWPS